MTIAKSADGFDPSQAARSGSLWGLPFDVETARLVVLPVPWEVTVSYGTGTARGPSAILEASSQVDLHDSRRPDAWKQGIALATIPDDLHRTSDSLRFEATRVIDALERGESTDDSEALRRVNAGCRDMVARVRKEAAALLDRGKQVGVLGGDHSVPLGLLQALSERHPAFGVLHLDAHSDLRRAYEGFEHSHASIMYNALEIGAIERLVQVGIRDLCEEEAARIEQSAGRVRLYDYRTFARRRFRGETFGAIADEIVEALPAEVYVSFDIDGLDPALCPGTGTPVPGGLQFEEALYLVERVRDTGRSIIGFDLCEVSPGADPENACGTGREWDANVGARVLYRLCCAALP